MSMSVESIQFILDAMDEEMELHANNTACISYAMGQAINCPPEELEILWFTGLLHECGNLVKDKKIKVKDVKSTDETITCAVKLINTVEDFETVAFILAQVEENVDGSGKPNKLAANEIHTLAKVVRIASTYDKYRLADITHELTCQKLRENADKIFPKRIITPFIKCLVANNIPNEYDTITQRI